MRDIVYYEIVDKVHVQYKKKQRTKNTATYTDTSTVRIYPFGIGFLFNSLESNNVIYFIFWSNAFTVSLKPVSTIYQISQKLSNSHTILILPSLFTEWHATHASRSVVCLHAGVPCIRVSRANTSVPIKMPFGGRLVWAKGTLSRDPNSTTRRETLREGTCARLPAHVMYRDYAKVRKCAAAVRPFVKSLWTLVYSHVSSVGSPASVLLALSLHTYLFICLFIYSSIHIKNKRNTMKTQEVKVIWQKAASSP